MDDCIFCKIIKGELPATFIYTDEKVVVFKNIEPVATHHYLVVPKKHIETFLDIESDVLDLVKASQKVIRDLKLEDGYKVVFNGGKYQSIAHVHIHLLSGNLEAKDDILNRT